MVGFNRPETTVEHLDKFDGMMQHLIGVEEPIKRDKNILLCNSVHTLLALPFCHVRDRLQDCGGGGVDDLGRKTFSHFYESIIKGFPESLKSWAILFLYVFVIPIKITMMGGLLLLEKVSSTTAQSVWTMTW
jgi:hypothetical protein